MPQKDPTKKTSVSKLAKEKHVHIVKHFQPISYSKEHRNYEFPEVDNEVDEEYLNQVTNRKRFSYQDRKPKSIKDLFIKNEKITNSAIVTRKRNKRGIQNNREPYSKSQPSLESTKNSRSIEMPKPFLTKKSKSFLVNVKQPERVYNDKNKRKNILISSSSPNFNETYVTNLKREISQNRCKTADAWLDTKLYLMHKNEIHNEKVKHLREEISKLINTDLEQRKNHVIELKTEIAEFKRNDCFAVYNVETSVETCTSTEVGSEKDIISDETDKSSTSSVEVGSKDDNVSDDTKTEEGEIKATTLTEIEEERNEEELNTIDLTDCVEPEENETPTGEKLCILEEKNVANAGLYTINISDQEDFIKAKILEANMLIDRVKDTLCDIKNKSKRDKHDHGKYTNNVSSGDVFIPQIHYEPSCCETPESVRPKTRRTSSYEKKSDVEDKFKNTLCDKLEATDSLEVLQAKLNTIAEQAESDSMSGSECKEHNDGKVGVDIQIQESVPQQSSAVQVKPDITSTGVQITSTELKTAATQTDRLPKKLCLETNCVVTIPAATPKLCTMQKLSVQHMPPIDIKRKLVTQCVLKFYIDCQGRTYFISQNKEKNNRFYEVSHGPPSKIKFEKGPKGLLRNTSSELSFYMGSHQQLRTTSRTLPCPRLFASHSDGELITMRKKQLKESIETKAPKERMDSKELILKSFHIYDNPNMHDIGDTRVPVNVSSIDTFIYKTYINPDGLPTSSSISNHRAGNIITPETLQKISQHNPVPIKNLLSENKKAFPVTSRKKPSSTASTAGKKQVSPTPKETLPIDLYDIGLYSAKSTQVENSSFKSTSTAEKSETKLEDPKPTIVEASVSSYDKEAEMSYEKISITVSYSTEESATSDSTVNKDLETHKVSDYIQKHERELRTVEPSVHNTMPEPLAARASHGTFLLLKEKFAKEGYNEDSEKQFIQNQTSAQSTSISSTIPEFIMSLTKSTTHELKKILPHIRKNVTSSKSSRGCSDTGSSRRLYSESNAETYKDDPETKQHSKDYTVLSMQIQGDCVPNDSKMTNSHLKLGKNGRYKDEENLFCEGPPKLASLPLRRRASKYAPRHGSIRKYALDSSSGDTVSVEPSFSEGEIKCQSSASIGEIRRQPFSDHLSKIGQKLTPADLGPDANVIRQRRTYFNHWITYYINKNAGIPLLNHSSSTSST